MTATELTELAAELREAVGIYRRLLRDIHEANERLAKRSPEDYDLRAVGSILHDVYRGAEGMFIRIAKRVDEETPSGDTWHSELLQRMAQASPGLRPAVISPTTHELLEPFRAFRHLQRNIYGFELLWPRMEPLFDGAPDVVQAVADDVETFAAFLESLAA
jgi:hypothetical protein